MTQVVTRITSSYFLVILVMIVLTLKGLAMIFAGQENPFIIFRSKEIYIYFKTNSKIPHKFAEITKKKKKKKNRVFGKFHS